MVFTTGRVIILSLAVAVLLPVLRGAQANAVPPKTVAGIPANYDEANVGTYTLPNPLLLSSGEPVRTARTWYKTRRPEIVRLFEENQFGRSPRSPGLDDG